MRGQGIQYSSARDGELATVSSAWASALLKRFFAGPRAGKLRGRTGIWYYDTRDLPSNDLREHARRLPEVLGDSDRINQLRVVLGREHAHASVSFYWCGARGAPEPIVPDFVVEPILHLGATIETDFQRAS